MRRPIMLSMILAASVAVLGACGSTNDIPKPPATTPVPTATTSPSLAVSPSASPTGSPIRDTDPPETVKPAGKDDRKDARPLATETPKVK